MLTVTFSNKSLYDFSDMQRPKYQRSCVFKIPLWIFMGRNFKIKRLWQTISALKFCEGLKSHFVIELAAELYWFFRQGTIATITPNQQNLLSFICKCFLLDINCRSTLETHVKKTRTDWRPEGLHQYFWLFLYLPDRICWIKEPNQENRCTSKDVGKN